MKKEKIKRGTVSDKRRISSMSGPIEKRVKNISY